MQNLKKQVTKCVVDFVKHYNDAERAHLKEQVTQCVTKIVTQNNQAERDRDKTTINYLRDKLLARFEKADKQCNDLLEKTTDIAFIKERNANVAAYHNWSRERDAFRYAMEVLSDVLVNCPTVKEDERWNSDIHSYIMKIALDFAVVLRAEREATTSKQSIVKQKRSRVAAKKSTKTTKRK